MPTQQPQWRYLGNLGDADPISYGGYFVYRNRTGTYGAEAERLEAPDGDVTQWEVHRIRLDQLQVIEVPDETDPSTVRRYLVSAGYDASWPHPVSAYNEWFARDLPSVAATMDYPLADLYRDLCAEDPMARAHAYRALADYHGWASFDSDPLTFTKRGEVTRRYRNELRRDTRTPRRAGHSRPLRRRGVEKPIDTHP